MGVYGLGLKESAAVERKSRSVVMERLRDALTRAEVDDTEYDMEDATAGRDSGEMDDDSAMVARRRVDATMSRL